VTTFLWVLAAIGAVLLAWLLAVGLSRAAGGDGTLPAPTGYDSGKTRYERDNERPFNAAAFFAVALVLGALVALALALELS
jgi:hypothetical protein